MHVCTWQQSPRLRPDGNPTGAGRRPAGIWPAADLLRAAASSARLLQPAATERIGVLPATAASGTRASARPAVNGDSQTSPPDGTVGGLFFACACPRIIGS